jgi:hypothetical protein
MKAKGHVRAAAFAALTVVAGALAGCATMPPEVPFVPDDNPDRAAVTMFREHQFLNGAFTILVRIDGKSVGELKNGGQLAANATPGDLKIAFQSEYDFRELVLPLHAEAGRDYYIDVLPRAIYLQQFAGGAVNLPKEKAANTVCNSKWCITTLTADDAKARMEKKAP